MVIRFSCQLQVFATIQSLITLALTVSTGHHRSPMITPLVRTFSFLILVAWAGTTLVASLVDLFGLYASPLYNPFVYPSPK